MTRRRLVFNSTVILFLLGTFLLCQANGQSVTFAGRIVTPSATQLSPPRFSVKLYPPLKSGKAVLLTNTDAKGNFKFAGLSANSYLLEIYLIKDLVYQEVVDLSRSVTREIDLRKNVGASQTVVARPNPTPTRNQNSRSRRRGY